MHAACPSYLILLDLITLIFHFLPQFHQQAVNIALLVISAIQSLERASKVG
jgi:hypothetical protein